MVEMLIPFAGAVFVTLLLRRLDKSNVNLRKLRTLIDRGISDMEEISARKKEELNDATVKFDFIRIETDKYFSHIGAQLGSARESAENIEKTRQNLLGMDDELSRIEKNTASVKDQLKFIHESLGKIAQYEKKIKTLFKSVQNLDEDAAKSLQFFQESLQDQSRVIQSEMEEKISALSGELAGEKSRLSRELRSYQEELKKAIDQDFENLSKSLEEDSIRWTESVDDKIKSLGFSLDKLESRTRDMDDLLETRLPVKINEIKASIHENLQVEQDKLEDVQNKIEDMEKQLKSRSEAVIREFDQKRNSIFERLKEDASAIKTMVDQLDFETSSKKDKILREAREEISRVHEVIQNFEVVYSGQKENLHKDLRAMEKTFEETLEKYMEFFHKKMEEKKAEISEEKSKEMTSFRDEMGRILDNMEMELQEKTLSLSAQINETEGRIISLRETSENDFDRQISGFYQKLGDWEKNMENSRKHITDTWEEAFNRFSRDVVQIQNEIKYTMEQKSSDVETQIENIKGIIHKFSMETDKKYKTMINSFEETIQEKTASFEEFSSDWLEKTSIEMERMVDKFQDHLKQREDTFERNTQDVAEKIQTFKNQLQEKEEKLKETLDSLKRNVQSQLGDILSSYSEEVKTIARQKTEEIKDSMAQEHEYTLNLLREESNSLLDQIQNNRRDAVEFFKDFEKNQKNILESLYKETRSTSGELDDLKTLLEDLKSRNNLVDDSRKNVRYLEELLAAMDDKISQLAEKKVLIDQIFQGMDEIRDLNTKMDAEFRKMAQKREKIDQMDEQIRLVFQMQNEIEEKASFVADTRARLVEIESSREHLFEYRDKMDDMMEDFVSEQKIIEKVFSTIRTQEENMEKISVGIEEVNSFLQKLSGRSDSLKESIVKLEGNMAEFKSYEKEIRETKDKFMEIEDLIADIDERKSAILLLRKDFEDLHYSMQSSVLNIRQIENDAEVKVKQLSDFMNSVSPTASAGKTPKGVGDKKEIILRLSRGGWSPEEIADKIDINLQTIETILSSYNQDGQ